VKIEVSVGEIIDKITILQIKEKHIKDNSRLKHIKLELQVLLGAIERENIEVPKEMVDSLREINQELWDTEDVIRFLEKQKRFDDEFIKHARLDAKLNDQRFLIKNKINNHCNSFIKEQKSYEGLYTPDSTLD